MKIEKGKLYRGQKGTIVLATKVIDNFYFAGVVVQSSPLNTNFEFGEYSETWCWDSFILYNDSVTLKNPYSPKNVDGKYFKKVENVGDHPILVKGIGKTFKDGCGVERFNSIVLEHFDTDIIGDERTDDMSFYKEVKFVVED